MGGAVSAIAGIGRTVGQVATKAIPEVASQGVQAGAEELAKKQQEEQAAAEAKKAQEEADAKKKQEEADAQKKAQEEADAKKKQEEADAQKKAQEEADAKKKQEEEEEAAAAQPTPAQPSGTVQSPLPTQIQPGHDPVQTFQPGSSARLPLPEGQGYGAASPSSQPGSEGMMHTAVMPESYQDQQYGYTSPQELGLQDPRDTMSTSGMPQGYQQHSAQSAQGAQQGIQSVQQPQQPQQPQYGQGQGAQAQQQYGAQTQYAQGDIQGGVYGGQYEQ